MLASKSKDVEFSSFTCLRKNMIKFSVFTSIYNRKHTLDRVWNSLKMQSYKNFEWIVVDDGSTDSVQNLLNYYTNNSDFPILIIVQKNRGKHVAWNKAVDVATGDFFVPADADDEFDQNTFNFFATEWCKIPKFEKHKFSGINVLCKDSHTKEIVGDKYPYSPMITNNLELSYRYKISGEKWGCIRVDCLKMRKNPEVHGSHLPESYIWYWLARKYSVICYNEPLRTYYREEDSVTIIRNKNNTIRQSESRYTYIAFLLNETLDYIIKYDKYINIAKLYTQYWMYSFSCKKSVYVSLLNLKNFWSKILSLVFIFPGLIFYLKIIK